MAYDVKHTIREVKLGAEAMSGSLAEIFFETVFHCWLCPSGPTSIPR